MSADTFAERRHTMPPEDVCSVHSTMLAGLSKMDGKLDDILRRIGTGDTQFAVLEVRLKNTEEKIGQLWKIVAVISTIVGTAIIGAVMNLILSK